MRQSSMLLILLSSLNTNKNSDRSWWHEREHRERNQLNPKSILLHINIISVTCIKRRTICYKWNIILSKRRLTLVEINTPSICSFHFRVSLAEAQEWPWKQNSKYFHIRENYLSRLTLIAKVGDTRLKGKITLILVDFVSLQKREWGESVSEDYLKVEIHLVSRLAS